MTSQLGQRRVRLGVIVPSSNTTLEPLTQQMVTNIPHATAIVSVHFARFRVTEIALSDESTSQFARKPMLEAAKLLADAKVDIIGWSGTSAAWLGFDSDKQLFQEIKDVTGISATSSISAMREILTTMHVPQVGLVTPYLSEINAAICRNFATEGFLINESRSRWAGLSTNFEFANLQEKALDNMMEEIVNNGIQVALIVCTNIGAARRAAFWEKKHQITVLDSVATVVYGMLKQLGIASLSLVEEWGSLFGGAD